MARSGVWLFGVGLVVLLVGCDSVPLTAPLWTPQERQEQAESYLQKALTEAQDGNSNSERVDELLALAARLENVDGEGTLVVARRLLSVSPGYANKVATLLTDAVQLPPLSENPLAFGVLALAHDLLADSKGQQVNQERATELVGRALDLLDKAPPTEERARLEQVRRLTLAGRYCDEFLGDGAKAVRLLRGAVHLGPADIDQLELRDAQALSALGLALARYPSQTQDKGEATRLTRVAAQFDSENEELLLAYGLALQARGELAGARRVLGEVVELSPNLAEAHGALGEVLAQLKLYSPAALELERALLLQPQSTRFRSARAALPNPLPSPEDDPEEVS